MAAAFFTWLKNFKASTKSRGYAAIDAQTLAAITPCLDYFIGPISNNEFISSWKFEEGVIQKYITLVCLRYKMGNETQKWGI